jgi:hypothetical protein
MGRHRHEPRRRDRGGDGIPTPRPEHHAAVATAFGALGLAATLGATASVDADGRSSVIAGAVAAVVLLSLALSRGRHAPIPAALVALATIYVTPDVERTLPAPLYGSALLLIAELAYWSLDERGPRRLLGAGAARARLVGVLAILAAALAAATAVQLGADVDVQRTPAVTAIGAAALVACLALLAALARARQRPPFADRS